MKNVVIAFDIDGTLRNNQTEKIKPNEKIRNLLVILSTFKNVKIVVWSGSGELYARQVAREIGIQEYVDAYASKNHIGIKDGKHLFNPDIKPDIAIDDIQACELGNINLIVNEKYPLTNTNKL